MTYAYNNSVKSSNPDYVLSKTFGLVGMSMIPTVIFAYLVSLIPMTVYAEHPIGSIVVFIGIFILSLVTMFFAAKQRSESGAIFGMMLFASVMGAMIGPTIMVYMHKSNGFELILGAASLTGIALFGLTAYAVKSKRDFSYLGGFLFAALLVLIGGGILQMFFHSPLLHMIMTVAGVLVFIGYILYDVSRIVTGGEDNYVFAAINIYLDVLNLFLYILEFLGEISGNDD